MLDAAFLMGSYAAMSAGMSAMIAKVSPSIGPRMRHLFAGSSPLAVLLAMRLEGGPSTTLDSMDLFSAGGLLILGIITSSAVGKVIPTQGADRKKLSAR
ncbi:hypothetical protein KUW15_09525 [Qipengyuania aquimaris]|uniref:hypothetical protein n=1 Tax=Qipengyuania aquimaris TaxID=255984 RepID=UPI001C982761|nr:hypothetical protein [Qipengyuania aquimaris]MBY6128955.1 hypothetical protein [Qipengyuania aquimaris]UOR14635.1 hypothetical protein LCM05_09040 [Qipengyuania aquimaris]